MGKCLFVQFKYVQHKCVLYNLNVIPIAYLRLLCTIYADKFLYTHFYVERLQYLAQIVSDLLYY